MTGRASQDSDDVNDFLARLDPERRRHFLALERLMLERVRDLRWYYSAGQEFGALRGQEERFQYGESWVVRVVAALKVSNDQAKVSKDLLAKTLAFVTRFPKKTDLAALEEMKTSWSAVVTSLALGDRAAQLALLRQAAREKWPVSRLRYEVDERRSNRPQPRTGRPPEPPQAPEVELRVLLRRTGELRRYLDAKWLQGKAALLPGLQQTSRRQVTDAFRNLLGEADEGLGAIVGRLGQLRKGLREVGGNGRRSAESR